MTHFSTHPERERERERERDNRCVTPNIEMLNSQGLARVHWINHKNNLRCRILIGPILGERRLFSNLNAPFLILKHFVLRHEKIGILFNIVNDWMWIADLWSWKRLLHQQYHSPWLVWNLTYEDLVSNLQTKCPSWLGRGLLWHSWQQACFGNPGSNPIIDTFI